MLDKTDNIELHLPIDEIGEGDIVYPKLWSQVLLPSYRWHFDNMSPDSLDLNIRISQTFADSLKNLGELEGRNRIEAARACLERGLNSRLLDVALDKYGKSEITFARVAEIANLDVYRLSGSMGYYETTYDLEPTAVLEARTLTKEREAVINTASLLFLARTPKLQPLLTKRFKRILVPQSVMMETVGAGIKTNREMIQRLGKRVKSLIEKPIFKVSPPAPRMLKAKQQLGASDRAALSLAMEKKIKLVLIDETQMVQVAHEFGLSPYPISTLAYHGLKEKWLEKDHARSLLELLFVNEYHLSSQDYLQLINALR